MASIAIALIAAGAVALAIHAARDRRAVIDELRAVRAQLHEIADGFRCAAQSAGDRDHAGDEPLLDEPTLDEPVAIDPDPDSPGSPQPARGRTVH